MSLREIAIFVLGFALLAPQALLAQSFGRRGAPKEKSEPAAESDEAASDEAEPAAEDGEAAGEEEPAQKAPRRKARKKGQPEDSQSGTDKESIQVYLEKRLKAISAAHRTQTKFGSRSNGAWEKFWGKVYEDRRRFEINMAKQRLNLFESLTSLEPGSHTATITQFEQLQATQIKSFETDLKNRMDKYFAEVMGDLKKFSLDQEKERADFMVEASQAWKAQKDGQKNGQK